MADFFLDFTRLEEVKEKVYIENYDETNDYYDRNIDDLFNLRQSFPCFHIDCLPLIYLNNELNAISQVAKSTTRPHKSD